MELTVLDEAEVTVEATIDGDSVWIAPGDLESVAGWTNKPEGLCRGDVCVPVRDRTIEAGGKVDLAAVHAALGKTFVLNASAGAAAVASDPMRRGDVRNLHEVTLPDLNGQDVNFSRFAGTKTLLLAWASW